MPIPPAAPCSTAAALARAAAVLEFYAVEGHYRADGPGSQIEDGFGFPHRVSAIEADRGDLARVILAELKAFHKEGGCVSNLPQKHDPGRG
jgi:hypothetical protein